MNQTAERIRVNPRRAHAMHKTPWPWHDRTGRFSWLKSGVLVLELAPALVIAAGLALHRMGPHPAMEAVHQTGLWSIRFLLLSLLISPARAIFNWHRLVLVRRQLGLTALFYALAHVVCYAGDQGWDVTAAASEILKRFYLEIGLVSLTGLAVLGVTSTDGALRQMGHAWKRVHKMVYGLTALGLLHYFIQSKVDVSVPTVFAGLFLWLMGWRLLPAGPDRQFLPVLGLGVAAAGLTVLVEFAWYGLATNIAPLRPVLAEANIAYGPHPAGQVLLTGVCLAIAAGLFWAMHRERLRRSPWFGVALYTGGAAVVVLLAFAFNLTDAWLPDDWDFWPAAGWFMLGITALAAVRAVIRPRWVDIACGAALVLPLIAGIAL